MEKAFSLIKHKLIPADGAEYRQNLDEQLVCPTCSEPVFKKKLWVLSRQLHTHFFSHYFGEQDSCEERTKGEGNHENSSDHSAQLQRLEVFNKCFRENITIAFTKIIGKQASNKLSSALEYSERLCTNEIESRTLEKLEIGLINTLEQPITETIEGNLEDLEDALVCVYNHLAGSHGQLNLRFITCLALLLIFHKENEHLEDILKKKTLSSKSNLDALLLGNAVLLLANSGYVDWRGSTKSIISFINSGYQETKKIVSSKKNIRKKIFSGYFPCPNCNKRWWLDSHKNYECYYCKTNFFTDPNIIEDPEDELPNKKLVPTESTNPNESTHPKKYWYYCIDCKKQYYSVSKSKCPHLEIVTNDTIKKQ